MDKLDFSYFFTTKAQANDFLVRLANVSEKIYETDFDLEKELQEQIGMSKKDKFIIFLRDNNVDRQAAGTLKEFFGKMQETIASLPVLSLTLAFEPTSKTLHALSEWFVLNANKQVLFDIEIDPKLIAGAAITFKGKHLDFSIKPTFDQVLQKIVTPQPTPTPEPPSNPDKQQNTQNEVNGG